MESSGKIAKIFFHIMTCSSGARFVVDVFFSFLRTFVHTLGSTNISWSLESSEPSIFHQESDFHYFCYLTVQMKLSLAIFLAASSTANAFSPSSKNVHRSSALGAELLPKVTGLSPLDPSVIAKYDALPFPDEKVLAEYVWVDAVGNTRSKTRTLPASKAESVASLPSWNFDGSSTDQAPGDDSEVILKPQRIFNDPFRPRADGLNNILVMCDTYTPSGEPLPTNTRAIGRLKT